MRKPIFLLIFSFLFFSNATQAQDKSVEQQLDSVLAQFVVTFNKDLPKMGEEPFRMDSVASVPGKTILYYYTIMGSDSLDLDYEKVKPLLEANLIENVKTNPKMKAFRKYDVKMVYNYMDEHGKKQIMIEIRSGKYKEDK